MLRLRRATLADAGQLAQSLGQNGSEPRAGAGDRGTKGGRGCPAGVGISIRGIIRRGQKAELRLENGEMSSRWPAISTAEDAKYESK